MVKLKNVLLFSLSSLLFIGGCSLDEMKKEQKEKVQNEVVQNNTKEFQNNSINEILQNKKISTTNYKDFVNIFLVKSKPKFSEDEINSKMGLTMGDLITSLPKDKKKKAIEVTRAKLAIQKIIENSLMYDTSKKFPEYDNTYQIMYVKSRNEKIFGNYELYRYMSTHNSSKEHLKSLENFEVFTSYITKENSERLNNSFDFLSKAKTNKIYTQTYEDSEKIKTYTQFKKIKTIPTPLILKEKMIYADLFKSEVYAETNRKTLLNMFKFFDDNSSDFNLVKEDYRILEDNLNNLSEETSNNMVNYILELYINEYYSLIAKN